MAGAKPASPLLQNKRIAVVGGGPAGLTLARVLQLHGADLRLYELDASSTARDQGGELDLHEDSGQIAIRKAGLWQEFLARSRPEAQVSQVYDKHGGLHMSLGLADEKVTRPEIDRRALRDLLVASLAPNTLQWGRQLKAVERKVEGRHPAGLRLIFGDGSSEDADVLFGCDGTWSKVRPLVTPIRPRYSGVTFIETRVSAPERRHPEVAQFVGPGTIMVAGDDKALMAQRNGDDHIRVYLILRVPEDWARNCGLDFTQARPTRAALLSHFEDWAPRTIAMVKESDDTFVPRPLYNVPIDQSWASQPDIALLGDAAHVMPPFTGKGANYAMLDAVELAENLTSGAHDSVASAISAYEAGMLRRMSEAVAETMESQEVMISPKAPAGIAELFAQRIRRGLEKKAKG